MPACQWLICRMLVDECSRKTAFRTISAKLHDRVDSNRRYGVGGFDELVLSRDVGSHQSHAATAMHTAAGTQPYELGKYHHDSAELSAMVTVLSHFARRGTDRDSRQLRTIGPITGCANSQRSQRLLPRAKQYAAKITNGTVGITGSSRPIRPSTRAAKPQAIQSQRIAVEFMARYYLHRVAAGPTAAATASR